MNLCYIINQEFQCWIKDRFISMSQVPNLPITIISLIVVELLSIKELLVVGRSSG